MDESIAESADSSQKAANPVPEQLKPHCFQPGQSGNPGGRKKKWITEIYEGWLEKPGNRALVDKYITDCMEGAHMVGQLQLKEMAERVEGKVTQDVKLSGEIALSISERMRKARERSSG